MKILVINCGSSSLKFQLIDAETENVIAKGLCERIGIDGSRIVYTPAGKDKIVNETPIPEHKTAINLVLEALTGKENGVISSLDEIGAVGHRIVHGGESFKGSALVDDDVLKKIEDLSDLAPLHNPANALGIRVCRDLMPNTPNVAVFDTAFHQTMPQEAYLYGLPYSYYKDYKIRRYGFHGTSHSFVSKRCAELMGKDYENSKIIVCHLGNGASVSAVKNGKCIDTSMGLTPLEGLIMGTRSGSLDPSVVEFIEEKTGKTTKEVINVLNKESGLYGLSDNLSSDSRDIEDGYLKNDPACVRAMESFVYAVVKTIGSYLAALNGADAICFTAGIGENSPIIRKLVLERLSNFGITVDEDSNNTRGQDRAITTKDSKIQAYVIATNEELAIARDTYALVK